jgi:hypothetical protein
MAIGGVNVGQELLNVPMGDMIRSMALAIAQAQWELDKSSMTVTELMSGQRLLRDLDTGKLLDQDGKPTGETAKPIVIDSRVYFGYTYEEGTRVPQRLSMVELGFVPTFYQFVETIIEVRISISIHGSTDDTRSNSSSASTQATTYSNSGYWWYYNQGAQTTNVTAAQVNASYSSKYSYDVTGSSYLKTKLVPVPPPPILEARIRDLMEIERAYLKANPDQAKQTVRHQPPKVSA